MPPLIESLEAIDLLLADLPARALARGQWHFQHGNVQEITCLEPNTHYTASIRDNRKFDVELDFEGGQWLCDCSCRELFDCEHMAAALLALRDTLAGGSSGAITPTNGSKRYAATNAKSDVVQTKTRAPGVAQPPPSPLHQKLVADLGRQLFHEEAAFVRTVQRLYQTCRQRGISDSELGEIASSRFSYSDVGYWKPVRYWQTEPRDDFEFWLYVAWELQRREIPLPVFMKPITDLSLIEKEMEALAYLKATQLWKEKFRNAPRRQTPRACVQPIEFRLALHKEEARLQWRADPAAPFKDLKQVQARRLELQFEHGTAQIGPESLPLWSAARATQEYGNWWAFDYDDAEIRGLGRILRLQLPSERIVWSDGRPLIRSNERLEPKLTPPPGESSYYELSLVTPSGKSPGRILCMLDGQPALYLTEAGLYEGARADWMEESDEPRTLIPAAAIECADGIRFLIEQDVPTPEHLRDCIRTIPVKVAIQCAVLPRHPMVSTEEMSLGIAAEAPGIPIETLSNQDWLRGATSKRPGRKESGVIEIFDRSAQSHFPAVLEPLGARWDRYSGGWRVRMTKKFPETFVSWMKSLPPGIEVQLDPQLATLRDEPISGTVSLDISEADIDWFDLKVALNVTDTTLTPDELKLLMNARGGYVRLGTKGWRRLHFDITPEEDEQLARAGISPKDFSSEPQRFHALQLADTATRKFLGPDQVEKIERRVGELKTRVTPDMPELIRAQVRPYQIEGFHFLAYLTSNRFGGVLADDMGLGKTLQTLAWIAWLREQSRGSDAAVAESALVVCPKSVMDNWRAEAQRFYPNLRVRVWRGEPASELAAVRAQHDLVVVNYAQLRSLSPEIAQAHWLATILDEAQYIKNPDSQTAQAARSLKAGHRLALTGTPIENRLLDLWSIFAYAMPGALGNRTHFLRRFDAKDDPLARRRLAARVRPFLLRRTKGQVAQDLPDRIEEDLFCEMEGDQQTLYRAELKRARQFVLGLTSNQQLNAERFNILTSLLRLRQICCHPALVNTSLIKSESAKVAALQDLLEPLMEEGHKVLVFSQFVTMLDILRETVRGRGWKHYYLAGDTENRGDLVREFQSAAGGAVFLISLKAGGFGLNLTAASYVVLFDPWWNPAVENQAIDRTHRIGQVSKVIAYRLLIRQTVEEKIRLLQRQKAALVDDVLGEERFAQSLTLDDLRFLFAE